MSLQKILVFLMFLPGLLYCVISTNTISTPFQGQQENQHYLLRVHHSRKKNMLENRNVISSLPSSLWLLQDSEYKTAPGFKTTQRDQGMVPPTLQTDTSNLGLDARASARRRQSCLRLGTSRESNADSCPGKQSSLLLCCRGRRWQ